MGDVRELIIFVMGAAAMGAFVSVCVGWFGWALVWGAFIAIGCIILRLRALSGDRR